MQLTLSLTLFAIFQTAVFSLPLTDSNFRRDEDLVERSGIVHLSLVSRSPDVSLRRTKAGNSPQNEHWALHFHDPIPADHTGKVHGTTVDAQMNKNAPGYQHGTTPLETTEWPANKYHVQQHQLTHVAHMDHEKTQQAIAVAGGVHCGHPPLQQNCADWTKHAVTALHHNGLINQAEHDNFMQLHANNIDKLRENTDHHFQ